MNITKKIKIKVLKQQRFTKRNIPCCRWCNKPLTESCAGRGVHGDRQFCSLTHAWQWAKSFLELVEDKEYRIYPRSK